jgi:hypothetical protein
VGYTSLGVVEIEVEAVVVSELEVRAGVLDQMMFTLAGRQELDPKKTRGLEKLYLTKEEEWKLLL